MKRDGELFLRLRPACDAGLKVFQPVNWFQEAFSCRRIQYHQDYRVFARSWLSLQLSYKPFRASSPTSFVSSHPCFLHHVLIIYLHNLPKEATCLLGVQICPVAFDSGRLKQTNCKYLKVSFACCSLHLCSRKKSSQLIANSVLLDVFRCSR